MTTRRRDNLLLIRLLIFTEKGAATAFSGGIGIPLLSPLELNAIIEAQSGTPFKSAFTEGDAEVSGFSGAFPASFDEGFANDKDTEFYESPQHGEPPIPKDENGKYK